MSLSLKEAAEAVGKTKPAVLKAIQKGKISAAKDENGQWQIEPVELFRVYKPVNEETVSNPSKVTDGKQGFTNEVNALQTVIETKDDLIEQIKTERDRVYGLLTDQSKKQGEKETQLQEEIEALKAKVQAAERAELEKDFEVRGLKQKTAELEKSQAELDAKAKGYARKAQQLKEEAEKPWYRKLLG